MLRNYNCSKFRASKVLVYAVYYLEKYLTNMEFPGVGIRCAISNCKQLDFLPVTCSYCQLIFCKEHFHVASHACLKFTDNIALSTCRSSYYSCSHESCSNTSPVEIPCIKCKLHFCITHRHHGCLDIAEEQKLKDLEKWNKPKQEFSQAKATVDKQINNSLKKAKNSAVANKVQLMRLKGRAVGFSGIPAEERRYFLVYSPVTISSTTAGTPKAVYTCARWTVGRTIDTFADTLGLTNTNNTSKGQKLRLFHLSTGSILSNEMDVVISDLLSSSALIESESLILEYSNDASVDKNLYE